MLLFLLAAAGPGFAQSLGTFRWQLQPYCNVITVRVTQIGSTYTLDGTDDMCGASPSAAATGMAFVNPAGNIGFGLTLVVPPGPTPVHLNATIDIASLSGTWQDSAGNTGPFVFNPASASGGPRPPARQVLGGGLSLGGSAITDVGTPVNPSDAATKGYVDTTVAGATTGLATQAFVNSAVATATSGLATQAFVNSAVATATSGLATQAFVNSSVAAAMTGAILVTAAPADWVPFNSTDGLTFTYFSSVAYIRRATTGSNFLSVHPAIPTALYGRSLRLRGVQFCYTAAASATLNYIEVNTTTATADAGSRSLRLSDPTVRNDAACRYYALPTPYTLTAADGVNFFIQVGWSADVIFTLGRTTFVLEPTTTPVVVPTLAPDAVTVLSPGGADDRPSTGAPPPPARKQ